MLTINASVTRNENQKFAQTEGWVSIVFNLLLFALKYWAGIVTGSVAIIADAWHTLSDSLSSVFVIVGAKVSAKPADKDHPFGHGRAELISSILIGSLLGVIAYSFVIEGIVALRDHKQANFGVLAIVVTTVSILAKEGLAQYAFWIARRTNMQSVRADAWHHRSDAISSVVVLAGIFLGRYFWWMDGVLGIVVAILIFHAAYTIIRSSGSSLMGEKPDQEFINDIKQICNETVGFNVVPHHFHLHNYIYHKELTFHIFLQGNLSINEGHEIANKIECEIMNKLGVETTIHIEPSKY
jgi:cation diffusion facilitator family transporter